MSKSSFVDYISWNPIHGYAESDSWIWCPSIIQADDGTWRMFASRWPKSVPFHPCWLTNSEVVMAAASKIEGPYVYQKTVLPPRGAQWWDGRMTHNPRVLKTPNGFALFYTGVTHPLPDVLPGENPSRLDPRVIVARSAKRIGVALAPDLEGPWERLDAPILPTKPNSFFSFLTSNAAPVIERDGSVFMVFKGRAYDGDIHGPMMLGLARSPSVRGPYEVLGCIQLDTEIPHELEDPFCWKSGEEYHMLAKDMTGSLCGERHAGVHLVSGDGIKWQLATPAKAYSRTVPLPDGTTRKLGSLERASLIFQNGIPRYLVGAMSDGPEGFHTASRTWNSLISLKNC